MQTKISIYYLVSSRDLNDIRYLGKTKQPLKRRLSQHLSSAKNNYKNNYTKNYNYNWINKEILEGYEIFIKELDSLEITENETWEWLEIYWISQLKTWGFKLNNLTSGGDGNKNQFFSKESIEKRAAKIRNIPRPEEIRIKISKGLQNIKRSDETKQKISNSIRKLQGKSVDQYDLYGNYIKTWECIKDATTFYNLKSNSIGMACKKPGKAKVVNYYWKYTNSELPLNIDKTKYICQLDLCGNFIKEWYNMSSISNELSLTLSGIYKNCNHETYRTKNFIFCYYPEFISGEYKKYIK